MIRPQITYEYRCQGAGSPPQLAVEITLEQAIGKLRHKSQNWRSASAPVSYM